MKKQTQHEKIVKRLLENGSISTAYAIANCLTTKLSTRIGELARDLDVEFKRERIDWGNSYCTKYSIGPYDGKKLNTFLKGFK